MSMVRYLAIVRSVVLIGCAIGIQGGLGAQQAPPREPLEAKAAETEATVEQLAEMFMLGDDGRDRMTIPVSVADRGPYPFLIDTGAERTVISKELARALKLDAGRTVTLHSMTEVSHVGTAVIPRLAFSNRPVTDIHAPALSAEHLGAAGMIGVDMLQSHRVVFDFDEDTMTVTPARKRLRSWGRDEIVVIGRRLHGRLVLMDAAVEGQKVHVILDTGSQVTIGNEALRRKLSDRNRLPTTSRVSLLSVTGGRLAVDYAAIRRIRIGDIYINDMPIGFADVHPFRQLDLEDRPAMLLGMDVLRLFDRVSVDFARREVRFLPDDSTSERASGFRLAEHRVPPLRAGPS
jgi:predicted aspartyl protease